MAITMKSAMIALGLFLVLAIPLSLANGRYSDMMSQENMMGKTTRNFNDTMMDLEDTQICMNEVMEAISKTKDMNERHELMQSHITQMQKMMGEMQDMMMAR